ncbi:hypothetical protein RvY_10144 [Ramazzottius varieornatus]|uniref:Uncharacterized protein n=1 Tax=Ramazzottius varieornatus TaxID=947166 RepID=A0A1D1VDX5_RAMVA|nr:hypothetical protein RvY_10144 [Ramazzottius varieornatus]
MEIQAYRSHINLRYKPKKSKKAPTIYESSREDKDFEQSN